MPDGAGKAFGAKCHVCFRLIRERRGGCAWREQRLGPLRAVGGAQAHRPVSAEIPQRIDCSGGDGPEAARRTGPLWIAEKRTSQLCSDTYFANRGTREADPVCWVRNARFLQCRMFGESEAGDSARDTQQSLVWITGWIPVLLN